MNQTTQHEQAPGANQARARKDWEWFWRIVALLMLAFIAWAGWVLYQITPRSVVTPLAYAPQVKPIGPPQAAPVAADAQSASAPAGSGQASAVEPTALGPGTPQIAADNPAAIPAGNAADIQDKKDEQVKGSGLRLATEIALPPPGKQDKPAPQEDRPGRTPAGTGATAAGKDRR